LYADPQTITINGSAKSLTKTTSNDTGSKFATSDRAHRMSVSHQYGKRQRHQIRLEVDQLLANPLITGQYVQSGVSVYLVADLPNGFDVAQMKFIIDGFLANLTASSGANVTKLLGGES
jgi:hypothetical protein